MKAGVFVVVGALILAGCAEPGATSLKAREGQKVQEAVDTVLQVRALSLVVSAACRSEGISLRDANYAASVKRDVRNLTKQGYTIEELDRAAKTANRDGRLTKNAVAYLQARGVKYGDRASICAYGRKEMAAGSAVGRLLKQT